MLHRNWMDRNIGHCSTLIHSLDWLTMIRMYVDRCPNHGYGNVGFVVIAVDIAVLDVNFVNVVAIDRLVAAVDAHNVLKEVEINEINLHLNVAQRMLRLSYLELGLIVRYCIAVV